MSADSPVRATRMDRHFAPWMFALSVVYLAFAAIAIHLAQDAENRYADVVEGCGWCLLAMTPLFVIEGIAHWWTGGRYAWQNALFALLPPLRLGARDHHDGTMIWLPAYGWQPVGNDLAISVEKRLGYPMIGVALMILPLLAIENYFASILESVAGLGFAVQVAAAFIWMSFAMEFIVMISIVSDRIDYVKKHWMDLVIICLPLIAFMRVLRIGRLLRLQKLGKLSKTAKVFRLKGLAMRTWRSILLLELVDRIVHRDPEARRDALTRAIADKEMELQALREELQQFEESLLAEAEDKDKQTPAPDAEVPAAVGRSNV